MASLGQKGLTISALPLITLSKSGGWVGEMEEEEAERDFHTFICFVTMCFIVRLTLCLVNYLPEICKCSATPTKICL